jgi:hypothetical protein
MNLTEKRFYYYLMIINDITLFYHVNSLISIYGIQVLSWKIFLYQLWSGEIMSELFC